MRKIIIGKCAEAFLHTRLLTRNDMIVKRVFYAKICSVQLYEQCEAADDGAIPEDIMMKILIYGYMNDSFSSRKIEQLCKRDIHFMWLLDGFGAPDHSTISRFRQKMGEQIERVFYAVVKYLLNMKEISGENLFIDGTKIEANANRYTFVWKKAVSKNEQSYNNMLF